MEFTGERWVPGAVGYEHLFLEHVTRYMFASHFVGDKRVLDAGCGSGYGSYHLAHGGARSVLGIDRSEETIAYCREHFEYEGLAFQAGDALNTELQADAFDVIVAFELFEHLAEPERFLGEMHRLLKPGGVFVLSTPNANTYAAGGEHGENPYHVREYTPDEFRGFLDRRFPRIAYYAQSPWDGLGIFPARTHTSETAVEAQARLVLPSEESAWGGPVPAAANVDRCAYLIAVCCSQADTDVSMPAGRLYGMGHDMSSEDEDRSGLLKQVHDLQSELEGRTRWVEELKQVLEARDKTIRTLQEEFEERSQWALELDRTVQAQTQLIASLQKQRVDVP